MSQFNLQKFLTENKIMMESPLRRKGPLQPQEEADILERLETLAPHELAKLLLKLDGGQYWIKLAKVMGEMGYL